MDFIPKNNKTPPTPESPMSEELENKIIRAVNSFTSIAGAGHVIPHEREYVAPEDIQAMEKYIAQVCAAEIEKAYLRGFEEGQEHPPQIMLSEKSPEKIAQEWVDEGKKKQ